MASATSRSTRPSTTSRSPPADAEHPEAHAGLGRPGDQLGPAGGADHHPGRRLGEQLVVVGDAGRPARPMPGADGQLGQGHPEPAAGHVVDPGHQTGPVAAGHPLGHQGGDELDQAARGRAGRAAGSVPSRWPRQLDGPARAGQGRRTAAARRCPRWRRAGPARPPRPGSPRAGGAASRSMSPSTPMTGVGSMSAP